LIFLTIVFLMTSMVSACDFWPRDLKPLAESISNKVSGETTAWLVDGDVVVIGVAGSPFHLHKRSESEVLATDIAKRMRRR